MALFGDNTTPFPPPPGNAPYFINREWCMGDSLNIFNTNFQNFDTRIENVATTVNTLLSSRVFQAESSFVYSANVRGGTTNLTNIWQDVFINRTLTPMRVSFTSPNIPTTAVVVSNIHLRNYANAFSHWMRIGRFASGDRLTHPTPTEILTESSSEGHAVYSESNNLNMLTFYPLLPNTTYTFGVQSFFYQNVGNPVGARVEVNGWHTAGAAGNGSDVLRNNISNINNWVNVYAESPSNAPIGPTQNIGIGNTSTTAINRVRNLSYLKVVLL